MVTLGRAAGCLLLLATWAGVRSSRNFALGLSRGLVPRNSLTLRARDAGPGVKSTAKLNFTGSSDASWRIFPGVLASALIILRGFGRGGGGWNDQQANREAKRRRESDQFFAYQRRILSSGGRPERSEQWYKREERELFGGQKMSRGINFENYDKIDVERKGGTGQEGVCEDFDQVCETFTMDKGLVKNILERCQYKGPTPVQKHAVPAGLKGSDVMVSAQTGSGKTAAFLIPMIAETLRSGISMPTEGAMKPLGVVLAPSRELCQQISVEARKLCFRTNARVVSIYGGADALPQLKALAEGAEIVVCTPGRLEDFIERKVISMEDVKYLCLDEADRMLDMGFEPQIRSIVEGSNMPTNSERQTMMFSATFPKEMQELAMDFLDPSYLWIAVGKVGEASANIDQRFINATTTDFREKFDMLLEAVDEVKSKDGGKAKTLVFANSKVNVNEVCWKLASTKARAMQIHGGLSQNQRETALNDFRNNRIQVLVATDVAARGLDLPGVDHVINYELPLNAEDYTHRIGRTGRIGNTGVATSLVSSSEPALKEIVGSLQKMNKEVTIPQWLAEQTRYSQGSKRNWKGSGGGGGRGRSQGGYGGGGGSYGRDRDSGGYGSSYGRDRSSGGYGRDGDSGGYGRDRSSGGYGRGRDSGGYGGRSDSRGGGYGRSRDSDAADTPAWARGLPPRQRDLQ